MRIFDCSVLFVSTLVMHACGSSPATPAEPAGVLTTTTNADSTRTVTRRLNGSLEGRTLVHYPNGTIESIFYFQRNKAEGIQRRFYPSGRLASWQQMHQGLPHGGSYEFAPSGALTEIAHYANGQHLGRNLLFYARPRNQVAQYIDYTQGDGREWKSRFVRYDTLGRVVERWGFLTVWAAHDTVALGDSLTLYLRERYPKHPFMQVVIGDYDAQFRLRDSASLGSIAGRGHAATLQLPATRRGRQIARGYFADVTESTAAGAGAVAGQRMYFAYPYFVR